MEEIFKNPKTISGLTELYKRSKQQDKNITLKDVKEFLKNENTSQIHKPLPNRNMHFFPITANKENDLIQIDLVDVSNISTKNKNIPWFSIHSSTIERTLFKEDTTARTMFKFPYTVPNYYEK